LSSLFSARVHGKYYRITEFRHALALRVAG